MLSYISGNLFEAPAQTLVNTVNTVGVMGKGIALTFKKIYPDMFREYQEICETGRLRIGSLFLYRTPHKYVLNFPTKEHWRRPSRPEYIEAGLSTFVRNYEKMRIRSIAFPPLGCGNGELDFEAVVRPIMDRYLEDLPIPVYVYAPHPRSQPPEHRRAKEIANWLRSVPSTLSFQEVWADLRKEFAAHRELRTLSGSGRFEARYMPDEEGVRIWTSSRTEFAHHDEFYELWRQLREFGLLTTRAVPGNRERVASYLFPILATLAYVRAVGVSDDFQQFRVSPTNGLQLVPTEKKRHVQTELELVEF